MFVRRTGSSWGGRVNGYCDRLRPVSIWSLRSLWSLWSMRKKSSTIIWKPLSSDRSDNDRWDRTFYISAIVVTEIAGEWFHMIAAIAEVFFFFLSDRSYPSDGGDIWKPGFYLIMAYFKRKDCFQRNLYLNCVSLWKSLKGEWYRMVRLNKCSNLVECVDFSDLSGATVGFV